jgi:class 3 adenylate cyclase
MYRLLKEKEIKIIPVGRLCAIHILLIPIVDTVKSILSPPANKDSIELGYPRQKKYLLMKKSGKKGWSDISFFNLNKGYKFGKDSLFEVNSQQLKIQYQKHNKNRSSELMCHLTSEYNLRGEKLNIRPTENILEGIPYYFKKSTTTGVETLYLFYFYCLQNTPEDDTSQTEQIHILASRDMAVFIPFDYFTKAQCSNLHPNFRMHTLIHRLHELDLDTDLAKLADGLTPVHHIQSMNTITSGAGVLILDLVDYKRFFDTHNHHNSTALTKAFLGAVTEIVHLNGGYVHQTMGDCFVVTVQKESAAQNAKALLKMAVEIQCLPWKTRIGLNLITEKQPLHEGYFGPLELGDYRLTSSGINIAARLEAKIKSLNNHGILMPKTGFDIEIKQMKTELDEKHFEVQEREYGDIPEQPGQYKYFYLAIKS